MEIRNRGFQNFKILKSKINAHIVQSIQEWTKWNLWKTALKNFEVTWSDWPIKCQCCPHIETSQLICTANRWKLIEGLYSAGRKNNLVVNRAKTTTFGKMSLRTQGAKIWNFLPEDVKDISFSSKIYRIQWKMVWIYF